ncbi:uncharacterized protein N0V89_007607 [Didymosphaeria variabile]|uniref:Uncharacterized protein n=1 Tax=Didymosphaeria variabile TaxID=1932322 RepID=A0A9W8XJ60_9PLEO|nr:uncharacterized protein N0V89_007607 [Didymosphaeria variabile]KAJ4352260.1 hypothetical protein N0V89_007607 [Didymosphaeria variabile]
MDQDYEIVVAAGLHTPSPGGIPRRKSVLLLYDCSAFPLPDLASKLIDLDHVVVLPATALPAAPPVPRPTKVRMRNVFCYSTQAPFERPSIAVQDAILNHIYQRTGVRKFFTVIVLGTPQISRVGYLPELLNTWSGISFHLVTEALRVQHEDWRACFNRYEDLLLRYRENMTWCTYQLETLNGIRGVSWLDVDEADVQRPADRKVVAPASKWRCVLGQQ